MANEEFPEPFGTCCFIDDNTIYVNVFHNHTLRHYHCLWKIKERVIVPGSIKTI